MPSAGKIQQWIVPGGFGVRFDSHVYAGYTVTPYYDSMLGKLIVHRNTREEAIACMLRALEELKVEGVATTASFQAAVMRTPEFMDGTIDTKWVERVALKSLL